MLKIKDSVDLKELEKFGLKYKKETDSEFEMYEWTRKTKFTYDYVSVFVWNRSINSNATDKLYDLIQAGLVEKVSD